MLAHQLLDNFITEQELWACTTCMACVQECPVMIEHVDTIVDLRRGLVLNESRFPEELKATFSNLERNFTPWGFGHSTRADWAEGLDIPRMADVRKADVLFWVGCAGSYDARYTEGPRAFARLMQMAGVDFAILGTEEKCNGDPARRMGNEYLAQTLIDREHRDAEPVPGQEDRRHLSALPPVARQGVPAVRRGVRGRAPHDVSERLDPAGKAEGARGARSRR